MVQLITGYSILFSFSGILLPLYRSHLPSNYFCIFNCPILCCIEQFPIMSKLLDLVKFSEENGNTDFQALRVWHVPNPQPILIIFMNPLLSLTSSISCGELACFPQPNGWLCPQPIDNPYPSWNISGAEVKGSMNQQISNPNFIKLLESK